MYDNAIEDRIDEDSLLAMISGLPVSQERTQAIRVRRTVVSYLLFQAFSELEYSSDADTAA